MSDARLSCVELFSGAGGMAIGLHKAGFNHRFLVEKNQAACKTLVTNQRRGFKALCDSDIINRNIQELNWNHLSGKIDLVAGGPPCQPFSMAGKGLGVGDPRDMFPEAIRAVSQLMPKAFLFENVKGLTQSRFHNYLQYIKLRLEFPDFSISDKKTWDENFIRLQRHQTSKKSNGNLRYNIFSTLVNAADYGVPQKRFRFFLIGFRSDVNAGWNFPPTTHSESVLHYQQNVTREYWTSLGLEPPTSGLLDKPKVPGFHPSLLFDERNPWKTVRQAISDLPNPGDPIKNYISNHEGRPGAKSYPGHTGSILDEPSKTLKAGDHGVPGGENMLRLPNGSVRYFSIRECARLQTFPDDYAFTGGWVDTVKQLGNAVPVDLAEVIGRSLHKALLATSTVRSKANNSANHIFKYDLKRDN